MYAGLGGSCTHLGWGRALASPEKTSRRAGAATSAATRLLRQRKFILVEEDILLREYLSWLMMIVNAVACTAANEDQKRIK